MAFSVYKSGQGYWTRLMSAVGAGVLVAAAVHWAWNKLEVFKGTEQQWVVFVQASMAVVLLAIFGLLIFKFVGSSQRTCDFLIATEGEMKKVNWPTQKEVIGATWVVIACVFLLVALLFLADLAFASFFKATNVIHTN